MSASPTPRRGTLRRSTPLRALHALAVLALALAARPGCTGGRDEVAPPPDPPPPEGAEVMEWDGEGADEELSALSTEPPPPAGDLGELPIERAPASDSVYDSDETVRARRVVYRVRGFIPTILGTPIVDLAVPAAELYVDVSVERLRARFVGPGWPVHDGAEVRIRGDSPGSYVFDGRAGRSLEPGALASWFEGGPPRPGPRAYVRRDSSADDADDALPGPLVCALVAEWAGVARADLRGRCGNVAPVRFRAGAYRAERTADVPLTLPRRELRADDSSPPPRARALSSRPFLEPAALARLRSDARHRDRPVEEPHAHRPEQGLVLENRSDATVIVVVDGVAAGYVDAHSEITLVGLRRGIHEVGAMRPLGAVVMRPRLVEIPARTILRAPPAPRPTDE